MGRTSQTSRKRQKLSDREQNLPSIDRLSDLPDSVLCHILSFLPTKLSVATNILARRWRFLWAHVPNLDFDDTNHDNKVEYFHIISRVMLLHKVQRLNTFRLSLTGSFSICSVYQLETWITTAIARHVQKIDLCLYYQVMLPKCLFTCKTLVDLRLHSCVGILCINVVSLPSLKKLQLSSVQYEGNLLPHLLSGCPVLEELIIEKIVEDDLVCCNIFSPSIKRLMVNFQFTDPKYFIHELYNHDYKLEINAPALRYLQVEDCLSENFSAQMLTSLTEADIGFHNYKEVEDDSLYTSAVLNFIGGLCNVKCLKLSSGKAFCDAAFADQCDSLVRFDNLTKLELAADWLFLIKFLKSAANLEVLIVRQVDKKLKYWMEPFEEVPKCLSSHLRTITIDHFGCAEHEFNMVRYILRNAQVLKRMEIYSRRGVSLKARFDALQRISLFQRGSVACEIAFY